MFRPLGRREVAESVLTEFLGALAAELARWAVEALREKYSARNKRQEGESE